MSRGDAIECAASYFDDGDFFKDLERRVAIKTESQIFETRKNEMSEYMEEMHQTLAPLGFDTKVFENPNPKPVFHEGEPLFRVYYFDGFQIHHTVALKI